MNALKAFPLRAAIAAGGVLGYTYNNPQESLSESKVGLPAARIQPVFSPELESEFLDYDDCSVSRMSAGKMDSKEIQAITTVVAKAPISEIEAECAIETITSNRDHLRALLPPFISLDDPKLPEIFSRVKNVVTDQQMMATMMRKMQQAAIKNEESVSSSSSLEDAAVVCVSRTSSPHSELSTSHTYAVRDVTGTWEELVDRYPCTICKDVLAAPTVLNCSHNFCGPCVVNWNNSCTSSEEDVVARHCPVCKEDFKHSTFERTFDVDICNAVDAVPDCEAKTEWKTRRADYLREMNSMEIVEEDTVKDEPQDEEDGIWKTIEAWAIPILSVAVILLIMSHRKN